MKKQRFLNRVESAVLALVMAAMLCISPVASKTVSADSSTDIAEDVEIVTTQVNPALREEEAGDMSSYFTLYYNGAEAGAVCDPSENWYSNEEGYTPLSELFELSYSEIIDGTEIELEEAPTDAGSYKAYAILPEEYYYVYDWDAGDYSGYFYSADIATGVLEYTIGGEEAGEGGYEAETLELIYGDETLPDEDAFVLLMFGDGFTADEQQNFYKNAVKISDYIMETSPWDEFQDTVKIYVYGTVSNESGARADKAETQAEADADTRDTYFGTSFWTGGMQRLLSVGSEGQKKVNALKEENCPYADYSVIIVNSDTYGGSGGDICVASLNSSSLEMMLHELGHTVADLADEYWAGKSYAAESANMTQESDPEKVRWARFVGKNGVGVYKYDQSETTDWYRPSENCKMEFLSKNSPFCEVCKETLRKAFCEDSNVTKMFFQTYADEFYQSDEGKDMKEYFILRKNGEEVTGDQLGDSLTLTYYDAEGNLMDELPSQEGSYTIVADYEANDAYAFDSCTMTVTYEIDLPNLISFEGVEDKVYDGTPVEPKNIQVDYDGEYIVAVHYTGTIAYATGVTYSYDDDVAPIKPGKYTVTVTAMDKEGTVISRKSKDYQIRMKTTSIVNNDSSLYPGAQDWYNNKHVVIVGEGFTAEEQDKFEELAQQYVDYILNTEPFKETHLYFNFTSAEAVSDESGLGGDSYFQLSCDENGKIIPDNLSAISTIGYNNVSQYYAANIIIVNDDRVTEGAVADDGYRGYFYGGADEDGMEYVARELLNYLTGHEEGYTADTKEEKEAQRAELLNVLYYTWYGEDYAIVVSRAYDETFVENGSPIELNDYFQTYILGKEVPKSEINYTLTYFDSEGNELDGAPAEAGSYYVLGELIPTEGKLYASDDDGNVWELREGETYDEDGYVYDADGNVIGYLFWDDVEEVVMDGTTYHVTRARAYVPYTIQPSGNAGGTGHKGNASDKTTDAGTVKTGDTASWMMYLVLMIGAAVISGNVVVKRRK